MRPLATTPARRAALSLALALLAACHDAAAPTAPPVPDPGDSSAVVDVAFCAGLAPDWVAFQDGDGAWTHAEPIVSGARTTFRGSFAANRGAIATAEHFSSGLSALTIRYGVPAELGIAGDTSALDCDRSEPDSILGVVAGLDTSEVAFVSTEHDVRAAAFAVTRPDFTLRDLTAGPYDVLATRMTRVNGVTTPTRVILRHDLAIPNGGSMAPFDFASDEAFAPAAATVTLTGLEGAQALIGTWVVTPRSRHLFDLGAGALPDATRPYRALPAARLAAGDVQQLFVSAFQVGNVTRAASISFRAPVDRVLALGPIPAPPALEVVATTSALQLRARFAAQPEYDRLAAISYQQGAASIVTTTMTAAYAERSSAGYTLVVPDLSGVPGFDARWALRPGVLTLWTSGRIGGTLPIDGRALPRDGDTRVTEEDSGILQP